MSCINKGKLELSRVAVQAAQLHFDKPFPSEPFACTRLKPAAGCMTRSGNGKCGPFCDQTAALQAAQIAKNTLSFSLSLSVFASNCMA